MNEGHRLAALLRVGRGVVSNNQDLINDPAIGDKGLDSQTFLDAVTGSVQRQVVIEAKIGEVSLDRSFEFGIDWSVVSSIGSVDLRLDSDAGGTQLRQELRAADDRPGDESRQQPDGDDRNDHDHGGGVNGQARPEAVKVEMEEQPGEELAKLHAEGLVRGRSRECG